MTQISKFSTAENFQKLNEALTNVDEAIAEAKLAVQAGIPNADALLKSAEENRAKIVAIKNTYFPTGSAPTTQ